jgi:bifunctional non-homologous end joining protein LigD
LGQSRNRTEPRARGGRFFIEGMRSSGGATAVAPWSLLARAVAPASRRLLWSELHHIDRGDLITINDVMGFLGSSLDDPWHDLLRAKQRIAPQRVWSSGSHETQ